MASKRYRINKKEKFLMSLAAVGVWLLWTRLNKKKTYHIISRKIKGD